jgi:imidazolonepropionase
MRHCITNATLLTLSGLNEPRAGKDMDRVGLIRQGAVLMEDDKIVTAGMQDVVMNHPDARKGRILDAGGRVVLPGFVDCHTHPIFGEARLTDFDLRLRGKSYEEISAAGGGIISSINAVRGTSEEELTRRLLDQTARFLETGTTTVEVKTGYGLDKDSELKGLRAIKHVRAGNTMDLVPTFLGAHAVPPEYKGQSAEYIEMMVNEVLPIVKEEGLARYVDAFCERGFFSPSESERFLAAGKEAGLGVRVHAEQLTHSGGAALAAKLGAASADHLDHATDEDLALLKAAGVVASLVPGSNQFLGLAAFPNARRIIDAGVAVALASDFNPGTCPCWNMQEVISLACQRMKMTPEEAICAATINGAWALGLGETHGSLEGGKIADLLILDCEDYRELAYYFGANQVLTVFKKGRIVHNRL